MKYKIDPCYLIFGICLAIIISTQSDVVAAPGWVEDAIASSRIVTVDSDAPAFVIYDEAETEIEKNGESKTHVRYSVKILNSLGLKHGILKCGVFTGLEIKSLKGWLIEATGEEQKLDKSDIAEIDFELAAGYYDDSRSLIASFDDVEAGDVIAYEYDIIESEYWSSYCEAFVFQSELPVLKSRFVLEIPKGWILNESGQNIDSVARTSEENRYAWEYGYLPYRPEEPYMPDWQYQNRVLVVSCHDPGKDNTLLFSNWEMVADWVRERFSEAIAKDPFIDEALVKIQSESSDDQLLQAVADYVRKDIRYVAVEIGEGRFKPRKASATFTNKYGDCKDKATLMIALLRSAGFNASPVLTAVDDTVLDDFPSPFQFNHAIVAIRLDSLVSLPSYPQATVDGWLYFDPTHPGIPLGELPAKLYGARILRVSDDDFQLTTLPSISPDRYSRRYSADARLTENNSLNANVTITDFGLRSSGTAFELKLRPVQDLIKDQLRHFTGKLQNPRISDFTIDNNSDSCSVSFLLEADNYSSMSGGMMMLQADFFNDDNPKDKPKKVRQHPFTFGKARADITEINWTLPDGWKFDGELEQIDAKCDIADLMSRTVPSENGFNFKSEVNYLGGSIPAEKYNDAYKFLKKLKSSCGTTAIIIKQ